ncbi:right-handed parallel beta-helix repeat-containing protein, partial [Chloroflexota bacterium]
YDAPDGIKLARSSDGDNWQVEGSIAHDAPIPAGYTLGHPWVVYQPIGVGGRFLMYASCYMPPDEWDYIYVLESTDGLNWHYLDTAFSLDYRPVSSAGTIESYWQTAVPFDVPFIVEDDRELTAITLWYRYSPDNFYWGEWTVYAQQPLSGTSAIGSFSFDCPMGDGHYEFYTVAEDDAGQLELPRVTADAFAGYTVIAATYAGEQTAHFMLPDTDGYFSFNFTPGLEQSAEFKHFLDGFMGDLHIKEAYDHVLTLMVDDWGIDLETDVLPSLGHEVAMGTVHWPGAIETGKGPWHTIFIRTIDETAAGTILQQWLEQRRTQEGFTIGTETYRTVEISIVNQPNGNIEYYAVTGGYIVIGVNGISLERFHQTIDLMLDGGPSLWDNADFQTARGKLTEPRMGMGYFDVAHFMEVIDPSDEDGGIAATAPYRPSYVGLSLSWADERMKVELWYATPAGMDFVVGSNPLSTAGVVPGDALLFVSGQDLQAWWQETCSVIAGIEGGAEGLDELYAAFSEIGIDIDTDIASWLDGEIAVATLPYSWGGIPGFNNANLLVAKVSNPVLVAEKLEGIIGALQAAGAPLDVESTTIDGVAATLVTSDLFDIIDMPAFSYLFLDDFLVIGYSESALWSAVNAYNHPEQSLSQEPAYQELCAVLSPSPTWLAYCDPPRGGVDFIIIPWTNPMDRATYYEIAASFIEPVKCAGFGYSFGAEDTFLTLCFHVNKADVCAGRDAGLPSTVIYVDASNTSGIEDGTAEHPYNTIQEGINAALAGYTVRVAAGTYPENITLKSGVVVEGEGADVTIIDGGGSGPAVMATDVDSAAKLDGFTITNGNGYGGGVECDSSSPVISNNIISGNHAERGGGIGFYNYSSPVIVNNIISDNTAQYTGGGIDGSAAGIDTSGLAPIIVNNTITGNTVAGAGGGISCDNFQATIANNIITHNNAAGIGGGGIACFSGSPTIDYNDVWNNSPDNYYSCPAGANDISQDPQFAGGGDYHLQSVSPCVDAGSNAATPGWLTKDFEGHGRIVDGNDDGIAVADMGADEYEPSALHGGGAGCNLLDMTAIWNKHEERFEGWLNMEGSLYYSTSDNGVNWTGGQAVKGLPAVTRGSVLRFCGRYMMWYGYDRDGQAAPQTGAIGMAFSDNGIHWQPSPENPLLRVEPGSWRSTGTYTPVVLFDKNNAEFGMWFSGRDDWGSYHIGRAWAGTRQLHDTVSKASWGDRVFVHPGAYTGQIYTDKVIQLQSTGGADKTIIDVMHEHQYKMKTPSGESIWPGVSMHPPDGWPKTLPQSWYDKYGRPEAKVEGFTICSADGPGILLVNTDRNARIGGNSVGGNRSGIAMVSPNVNGSYIEDNYIAKNGWYGILVRGNDWVGIKYNEIHENEGHGIMCEALNPDDWSQSDIEGNKISGNGQFGIYSEMRHGNFKNNTISGNGDAGIRLTTDQWPQVRNNSISRNGDHGIWVERGHMDGNAITGNNDHGIRVDDHAWVTNNEISNNDADGIHARSAEIRNNSIHDNNDFGIYLWHGYSSVLYNNVFNNDWHGIYCDGDGHNIISGNTVSGHHDSGLDLDSFNLVSGNDINGNGHGIWISGDSNQILANNITNNSSGDSGIHLTVDAEDNVIHYNNIEGNVSHGVYNDNPAELVDAENNWWNDASGPGSVGPGAGDTVSDYIDYDPWLGASFSDTTSPVVDEAVAVPDMIAVFSMVDKKIGVPDTDFIAAASDDYSGVVRAEVNLKEFLLQLWPDDFEMPPDMAADWPDWIQRYESRPMNYRWDWEAWRNDFHLWDDMFDDIQDYFNKYGLGDRFEEMLFKLNCGELTVPVTVWDGCGNSTSTDMPLAVVHIQIPVGEGWNLRSTPVRLEIERWADLLALGDGLSVDAILTYDAAIGWVQPVVEDPNTPIKPLYGYYLHATANDQVG